MSQESSNQFPEYSIDLSTFGARARQNSRSFWVIGAAWIGSLAILAAIFVVITNNFIKAQQDFDIVARDIGDLRAKADNLIAELEEMRSNLKNVSEIQELHTTVYATVLRGREVEGVVLSTAEKDFLSRVEKKIDKSSTKSPTEWVFLGDSCYSRMWTELDSEAIPAAQSAAECAEYYQQAIALGDEDAGTLQWLGFTLYYGGLWQEAIDSLEKAVASFGEDSPESIDAYTVLGLCRIVIGDLAGAVASTRKAMDLAYDGRQRAGAQENLGLVHLRLSEWQGALDNSGEVKGATDELVWNWLIRSIAADKLGQREIAEEAHAKWLASARKRDQNEMQQLLPPSLTSYVVQLP
jgi:Tfp pilus assembly protein PilF